MTKSQLAQPKRSRISVKRVPGKDCSCSLRLTFDPKVIGPERTDKIWQGIGLVIANVLEPSEYPELLAQMERAKRQAGDAS